MKSIPKEMFSQSTSLTPSAPGEIFYADVLRRTKQKKIVTRDSHSSFTCGSIIDDETANTLRTALIINTSLLRGDICVIGVDNASGFQALHNDQLLHSCGITLDFGHIKNKDSNSVIDKGIQELEHEILRIDQSGTAVSPLNLQLAIDSLNKRIRNRGVSAKEVLLPRDQYTKGEIPIDLCAKMFKFLENNGNCLYALFSIGCRKLDGRQLVLY